MSSEQGDVGPTPAPAPALAEGGERTMTNKERRKALQAEKAAKREELKRKRSEDSGSGGADPTSNPEGEGEGEEVLSHKEARQRRKMEKKGVSHSPKKAVAAAAGAGAGAPARSAHSVWVGNLSFGTDEGKLRELFAAQGIEGVSRIHMPKGARKFEFNRGFAYVDLPNAQAVQAAVALSESPLDGRKLLIKSSTDYTGRPALDPAATAAATADKGKTGLTKTAQKVLRAQKNPPAPTLFIGNLSFNSTVDGLRALFEGSAAKRDEWKNKKVQEKQDKKSSSSSSKADKDSDSDSDGDSDSDSDSDSESDEEKEEEEEEEKESSDSESDSDSDSSDSDSDADERPSKRSKPDKPKSKDADKDAKSGGLRGVGIRNIRMGTFEDSGKCKGWAFVDFFSIEYATATLTDPRNTRLDGRTLVLEYAGSDAVRRGAPKSDAGAGGYVPKRPKPFVRGSVRRAEREKLAATAPEPGTFDASKPLAKRHKDTPEERRARRAAKKEEKKAKRADGHRGRGRARPGAALANAQRASQAIVASAGTKTTFE